MNNKDSGLSKEVLKEIRDLWENTPETALQIAKKFKISRNSIVGYASRNSWISFNPHNGYPEPSTMPQRLDIMHKALDQILADTATTIDKRFVQVKNPDKKKQKFKLFPGMHA